MVVWGGWRGVLGGANLFWGFDVVGRVGIGIGLSCGIRRLWGSGARGVG